MWEKKAGGKKYLPMGWVVDNTEFRCNIRSLNSMYELNFLEGKCFHCTFLLLAISTAGIHLRFHNAHSLSFT